MANWITHTLVADELLRLNPMLNRRGFVVGSIAPDCNVENKDWTAFTPPREITHFMKSDKKTSADLEGFWARYIAGHTFASEEERSFFLGYWAHLALDSLYMRFIRDEDRLLAAYSRIKAVPEMRDMIAGQPETLDTLKAVFGKTHVFADIVYLERAELARRKDASYSALLPQITSFPDYIDVLPPGAISRKIPLMLQSEAALSSNDSSLFFTSDEYASFFASACTFILKRIK